jgi:hypothetical protein
VGGILSLFRSHLKVLSRDPRAWLRENSTSTCRIQVLAQKRSCIQQTCNNDRQERDRLIQTLAAKHNLPLDGAPPLSDQAASAFYDAARQRLEEVQRNLQQMKVSKFMTEPEA